ncbi:MAG: hypothetical protein ACYC5G_00500 [Candidatus Doudnabacteria bacterium]
MHRPEGSGQELPTNIYDPKKAEYRAHPTDPVEFKARVLGDVKEYFDQAVIAKSADLEMIANNVATYIGISYWDGESAEQKRMIAEALRSNADSNLNKQKLVSLVIQALLERGEQPQHEPEEEKEEAA